MNTTAQRTALLVARLQEAAPLPSVLPNNVVNANHQRVYEVIVKTPNDIVGHGPFEQFVKTYCTSTQPADQTQEAYLGHMRETFASRLETLGPPGDYYQVSTGGHLRKRDGIAWGRGVTLTAAGKSQLLGWGGDAVNVAWRDFLFRAAQCVQQEKLELQQYMADRNDTRDKSKREKASAVQQLVAQGSGLQSAIGKTRIADRALYKPLTPGFASAAEAVCYVRGVPPTAANKKAVRNGTITQVGTQSFQWEHGRLRNRTRIMQGQTGADYYLCARVVAHHAESNNECRYRYMTGQPVDDNTQARINFDDAYDYNSSKPVAALGNAPAPLALGNAP